MAIPSIKDQINTTIQDFNFEEFGVVKEVEEYLGDLFGIDDLIANIEGALNKLEAFKDAIMSIIEKVLELFGMIMDFFKDIVGSLIGGILNAVSELMVGGGLMTKSVLESIKALLCGNQQANIDMGLFANLKDLLSKITFTSLIFASLCSGNDNAFSSSLDNHRNPGGEPLTQDALNRVDNIYTALLPGVLSLRGVRGNIEALNDISRTDIPSKAATRYPHMLRDSVGFISNIKNVQSKNSRTYSSSIRSILNRIDNSYNKPYINPIVINQSSDIKKLFRKDLLNTPASTNFSSVISHHTYLDAF